jgi:hypothetical protein
MGPKGKGTCVSEAISGASTYRLMFCNRTSLPGRLPLVTVSKVVLLGLAAASGGRGRRGRGPGRDLGRRGHENRGHVHGPNDDRVHACHGRRPSNPQRNALHHDAAVSSALPGKVGVSSIPDANCSDGPLDTSSLQPRKIPGLDLAVELERREAAVAGRSLFRWKPGRRHTLQPETLG